MRRKILTIILIIVLTSPILPIVQTASAAGSDFTVRVKLSMGTPVSVPVYLDGNYSVSGNEGVALQRQLYTVKLESGTINLYYGGTPLCGGGPSLTLVQHSPTDTLNNFIWLNNALYGYTRYLGDMKFSIFIDPTTGNPYIGVINHVYIEDYLYGVLPYEMNDNFPVEALKAQAVAARIYVERYMTGNVNYDVVDTSANQVYRGYDLSTTNVIQAVNQTANTILTCNGEAEPIQAFFSASNGGYTEIPQHRWSITNRLPYQIIQQDPYDVQNPYSSQEALIFPKTVTDTNTISYQYSSSGSMVPGTGSESANAQRYLEISALPAVAAKGYIASVTSDIQIVGINSVTPNTYEDQHDIKDYNGNDACVCYKNANVNMTVLAKKYVYTVNPGDVNSDGAVSISDYTLVRLGILGLRSLSDPEKAAADVNQDGTISISDYTLIRLDILGLKDILQDPASGVLMQESVTVDFAINMHEFDSSGGLYQAFNRSLGLFVVEQTETSWNIYHRRYGHGIGLSQRGAEQRALPVESGGGGQTCNQILAFYYPNTTITLQTYSKTPLTPITIPDSSNAAVISPEGSGDLNVRSTPDSSSDVNKIGTLPDGARINVTQLNAEAGWHKILYGGQDAYVYAAYVLLDP